MRGDKKARLGIIGCGRIAKEGHLPYLKENPGVTLAGAVDVNEKNRDELCAKFGIEKGYASPEAMFADASLDGVLICTPNWVHKPITLMAAEKGIHVFCEKPMAVNADECAEMVATCERAGVRLQIGMAKRFDPGLVKAKRMILDNDLGPVSQIATSCLNPPARLDTPMFETIKKWSGMVGVNIEEKMGLWRLTDARAGGGLLLEMGTHLLDMIFFFAGEAPSEWSGYVNSKRSDMLWEDQASLLLHFPSGVIGSAEMNMTATADNLIGERGRIVGEKASLDFNLINGMWFGIPLYHYIPTFLTRYGTLSPFVGFGVPVPVPVGKKIYMYKRQMDYFVDSILGNDTDYFGFGPDFAATGRDGLAAMLVTDAAYGANKKPESRAKPESKPPKKRTPAKKKKPETKSKKKKPAGT